MNRPIVESGGSEPSDAVVSDRCRRPGELECEVDQSSRARFQLTAIEVGAEPLDKSVVFRQLTESLPVMGESVVAVVRNRHRVGDQLAIRARKR